MIWNDGNYGAYSDGSNGYDYWDGYFNYALMTGQALGMQTYNNYEYYLTNSNSEYLDVNWASLTGGNALPGLDYNPAYNPGDIESETYEQYAAGGGASLVAQWSGTQNGFLVNNCIYDLGNGVLVQAVLGRTCPPYLSIESNIIQGGTIINDN